MEQTCLFCKIIQGDIPAKIVYQDEDVLAFYDIKPQAPVHILVIPKRHIPKIDAVASSDVEIIGKIILAAKKIAGQLNINENGYRLVFNNGLAAGQEVYHIHLHLLGGRSFKWPPG